MARPAAGVVSLGVCLLGLVLPMRVSGPALGAIQASSQGPRSASASAGARAENGGAVDGDALPREPSPFNLLPRVRFVRHAPERSLETRLYRSDGEVDETAAAELDELLSDQRDPEQPATTRIARRTLKLVFRAAYAFDAASVEVVSGYRKPGKRREGPHGRGAALDFRLPGVPAAKLAAYLRGLAKVGVGVYTHKRTGYVHLDVRDESFHWLDASPPGRRWREMSLRTRGLPARDAAYDPKSDWPERIAEAGSR